MLAQRQREDKEKQEMLNQSLRGQLQHDRERHAREANERLNATHPDPRRAIPMDFQLVPEDEVREKRTAASVDSGLLSVILCTDTGESF